MDKKKICIYVVVKKQKVVWWDAQKQKNLFPACLLLPAIAIVLNTLLLLQRPLNAVKKKLWIKRMNMKANGNAYTGTKASL